MFQNIEAERARNGQTKEQLAEVLGVTRNTINNWISGKTDIPASVLIKMSKMWNCSADYLLEINKDAS